MVYWRSWSRLAKHGPFYSIVLGSEISQWKSASAVCIGNSLSGLFHRPKESERRTLVMNMTVGSGESSEGRDQINANFNHKIACQCVAFSFFAVLTHHGVNVIRMVFANKDVFVKTGRRVIESRQRAM